MFDDAPIPVAARLLAMPTRMKEPDLRYFAAAGFLIMHYVGPELLKPTSDPFMRFNEVDPSGRRWQFPVRLVQAAELLFGLRRHPGFSEICRRLRNRDLQSAYFELAAASMFRLHGFEIDARPEKSKRGVDFDFIALRGAVKVNAETTSLRPKVFSPNTLANALNHKRKQLPSDAPAVIFVFRPHEWEEQVADLEEELSAVVSRFFRGSKRVNYVFVCYEQFIAVPQLGGYLTVGSGIWAHPDPRHACPALDEALATPPVSHNRVEALLAEPKTENSHSGISDFHAWVDSVLG